MPEDDNPADLRQKAELCRLIARLLSLREAAEGMLRQADAYEAQARAIEESAQRRPPDDT